MAPESLIDCVFSSQSDVWSFGVVLWELFSLGQMPYPGMSLNQLVQGLKNGYRMDKPEYATNKISQIMTECWNVDPSQRPTFRQLEETLSNQIDPAIVTSNLARLNESCATAKTVDKKIRNNYHKFVLPTQ